MNFSPAAVRDFSRVMIFDNEADKFSSVFASEFIVLLCDSCKDKIIYSFTYSLCIHSFWHKGFQLYMESQVHQKAIYIIHMCISKSTEYDIADLKASNRLIQVTDLPTIKKHSLQAY